MALHSVRNFIDGKWVESSTGDLREQLNPADLTKVTCTFQGSSKADAATAIAAAQAAFPAWRDTSPPKRAELFAKVLAAMERRRPEIAECLTLENGKTLKEANGEIDSAFKEMDWQIAEGRRIYGDIVPSERDGVLAFTIRQPLGVVSVVCPWNFPFNVPCRKCTPALMAGNTVVMKPASLTPRTGAIFVELFEEAGFPPGVINMVTGDGSTVGDEFVGNALVRAISFTGSTPVGTGIHRRAADGLVRTQLEMGGKNAVVVLADADLDAAADAAALAAFVCAGQWCTSTSRAIVESSIAPAFLDKLLQRVSKIRVGDGFDPAATMGPVCGKSQRDGVLEWIDKGVSEGAKLATGGKQVVEGSMANGCFIEPTVFTGVTPEMGIAKEEIFGPVLSVVEAADFDEALAIANNVDFGLCSSVYTTSLQKALTFVEKTEVGLTHVNLPTALKEPQLSFGGIKQSGVGLPEAGKTGIEFFTEHKVAYIKYR